VRHIHFVIATLLASSLFAQTSLQRPHIFGIAHVAFRISDLGKAGNFYEGLLGYREPFSIKSTDGSVAIKFIKVNDTQYVELFPGSPVARGQLDHFALYTDDLTAMKEYLLSRAVPIVEDIHRGRTGNSFLTVKDPDGHPIEIVQYSPTSLTAKAKGKFMPENRVSGQITHVGIMVASVGSATRFYRDVLGFHEFSRGGTSGGHLGWVNLRAPDGTDYVEFIPYSGLPSPEQLRAQNHVGLRSSDVSRTVAALRALPAAGILATTPTLEDEGNLPRRVNLFDPDGARVEIMEPISEGILPAGSLSP
jgi:lactoylglutathione lyase